VSTSNWQHWCLRRYTAAHRRISQTRASQRLRPVAVSTRLAPSHASYRGPELVWVTGCLMSPDRGFGTSCLLHCGRLTVSDNSENSWKRFCLSRTRLQRLVTLAFGRWIQTLTYLLTYLLCCRVSGYQSFLTSCQTPPTQAPASGAWVGGAMCPCKTWRRFGSKIVWLFINAKLCLVWKQPNNFKIVSFHFPSAAVTAVSR